MQTINGLLHLMGNNVLSNVLICRQMDLIYPNSKLRNSSVVGDSYSQAYGLAYVMDEAKIN